MKNTREYLKSLEAENKYFFHGSPHVLEELEPRQAKTFNSEVSQMVNDGEPAVAASPFIDVAIFRSIINRENIHIDYDSSFSYKNGSLTFTVNLKTMEQAKECRGYIYVFDRSKFVQYSPMEYRSKNVLKPIEVIGVEFNDLPNNISIKN